MTDQPALIAPRQPEPDTFAAMVVERYPRLARIYGYTAVPGNIDRSA